MKFLEKDIDEMFFADDNQFYCKRSKYWLKWNEELERWESGDAVNPEELDKAYWAYHNIHVNCNIPEDYPRNPEDYKNGALGLCKQIDEEVLKNHV
jgi:hypothetical protein